MAANIQRRRSGACLETAGGRHKRSLPWSRGVTLDGQSRQSLAMGTRKNGVTAQTGMTTVISGAMLIAAFHSAKGDAHCAYGSYTARGWQWLV